MPALGNPDDDAKAESFYETLKREEVYLNHYQTFHEAEANLGRFIGDVYNAKRLHSSLGYRPPVEFEVLHTATSGSRLCRWFALKGSLHCPGVEEYSSLIGSPPGARLCDGQDASQP
jgi:hypothetical protein